jgi:hypothetical protein
MSAPAKRSHILMATVDFVPEPYRILGLVEATVTVASTICDRVPIVPLDNEEIFEISLIEAITPVRSCPEPSVSRA